jgi:hypothetical protein
MIRSSLELKFCHRVRKFFKSFFIIPPDFYFDWKKISSDESVNHYLPLFHYVMMMIDAARTIPEKKINIQNNMYFNFLIHN